MIEDLWGERPPATATKSLQVHVSRLRKALQSGGDNDVLLTRGHGYVIELGPDELDADCFERLLDEGRGALAAGEPEPRPGSCVKPWLSGVGPLADFTYEPWAQAEIARLEELRLSGEERLKRPRARPACRRAASWQLVADNPMRERLRGQFMLALYRSGRQAQALEVYRAGRAMLVEELGSSRRRRWQLEQAVLEHDRALDPPAVTPPAPRSEHRGDAAAARGARSSSPCCGSTSAPIHGSRATLSGCATSTNAQAPRSTRSWTPPAAGSRGALGGSLITTFGLPAAQEDHAERALLTALAARSRLADLFGESLSVRIGVESGEVIAGAEGDQAITGQPLVAAGRLVRDAREGQIRVGSRATARRARGL